VAPCAVPVTLLLQKITASDLPNFSVPLWASRFGGPTSMADYYSVIARAVSRLPSKTDEARHAIYERARTALREALRNYDPPLSATELANEQAELDAAICTVEVVDDIRRGTREETRCEPWPRGHSGMSG
jgi:hypothetical protein